MIGLLILFQIGATQNGRVEIDRDCDDKFCQVLMVKGHNVILSETRPFQRELVLGTYRSDAQRFVSKAEAPIRSIVLPSRRNLLIATSYLDRHERGPAVRLHVVDSRHVAVADAMACSVLLTTFEAKEITSSDTLIAVSCQEEHSYNNQTVIWDLVSGFQLRSLQTIAGTFESFTKDGVIVKAETYDGVHPELKGTQLRFFSWDSSHRRLIEESPKREKAK